jgi:hypothetical protein
MRHAIYESISIYENILQGLIEGRWDRGGEGLRRRRRKIDRARTRWKRGEGRREGEGEGEGGREGGKREGEGERERERDLMRPAPSCGTHQKARRGFYG